MKQIKDPELIEMVKARPCAACGKHGPSDPDHIRTRGAGGDDLYHNVWPLCRKHHTERHKIGLTTFVARYPLTQAALIERGWMYDNYLERWARE